VHLVESSDCEDEVVAEEFVFAVIRVFGETCFEWDGEPFFASNHPSLQIASVISVIAVRTIVPATM
jgi:hypothetical protein